MIDLEKLELNRADETLWLHLAELRKRAIFSLLVLTVLSIVSYFFSNQILEFLIRPISSISQKVYYGSPYGAFLVKLQISFWTGLFLTSPLLLAETLLFIKPGLYQREKKFFSLFLLVSISLFLFGVALAAFAVIPATINFFLGFSTPNLLPLISINQYLGFYVWSVMAFGLAFETPIFLVGLVWFGVIELQTLKSLRRQVIVGIFIFAAVITPSPDPFSQCLLAIPMWLLFEASLIISGFARRRHL